MSLFGEDQAPWAPMWSSEWISTGAIASRHCLLTDELFNITLPRQMRNPNSPYALRLSILRPEDKSNQNVEPGIAFEAFGVTDSTEDMTEEQDGGNHTAQAFTDNAAITCYSDASCVTDQNLPDRTESDLIIHKENLL